MSMAPKRINGKTTKQQALAATPDLGEEAKSTDRRQVYLVTFPHPRQVRAETGELIVAPGSKTKLQMMTCFLDACANPLYVDARSRALACSVQVKRLIRAASNCMR